MSKLEVVLNLWYVVEDGIVYSLRIKAYVVKGTDEEKLAFLKERSKFDYLIAEPFPIPERFRIVEGAEGMPVTYSFLLSDPYSHIAMFEDAIKVIQSRFPAQSDISIPQDPLIALTPLGENSRGIIVPRFKRSVRF